MNVHDYGRHCSGYQHPTGSRRMRRRIAYSVILMVVEVVCLAWLLTHDGALHPIGNGLAAWLAFLFAPILFLIVFEDTSPRHK